MLYSNMTHIDPGLNVTFNGKSIKFKPHEDFLGVVIDSGLRFSEHVRVICNKLSKVVGVLYRLRDFVPYNTLVNLYYTLIYSYLLYGNIVWGGTFNQHLIPLKKIQKKLIRIITKSGYIAHTTPLFYQTNILKVDNVHKYLLARHMYKLRERNPEIFNRQHSYYARHRNDAQATFDTLALTQHSVSYKCPHVWNNLPRDIRDSESMFIFKRRVKLLYLEK